MMGWKKRKKKQKELTKKYSRQRRELLVFTLRSSQSVLKIWVQKRLKKTRKEVEVVMTGRDEVGTR